MDGNNERGMREKEYNDHPGMMENPGWYYPGRRDNDEHLFDGVIIWNHKPQEDSLIEDDRKDIGNLRGGIQFKGFSVNFWPQKTVKSGLYKYNPITGHCGYDGNCHLEHDQHKVISVKKNKTYMQICLNMHGRYPLPLSMDGGSSSSQALVLVFDTHTKLWQIHPELVEEAKMFPPRVLDKVLAFSNENIPPPAVFGKVRSWFKKYFEQKK